MQDLEVAVSFWVCGLGLNMIDPRAWRAFTHDVDQLFDVFCGSLEMRFD